MFGARFAPTILTCPPDDIIKLPWYAIGTPGSVIIGLLACRTILADAGRGLTCACIRELAGSTESARIFKRLGYVCIILAGCAVRTATLTCLGVVLALGAVLAWFVILPNLIGVLPPITGIAGVPAGNGLPVAHRTLFTF